MATTGRQDLARRWPNRVAIEVRRADVTRVEALALDVARGKVDGPGRRLFSQHFPSVKCTMCGESKEPAEH